MNRQREAVRNAAASVGVVDSIKDMKLIGKPGMAAVIWRRQPLAEFRNWMDNLDPECLPDARLVLHPAAVRDAVSYLCARAGMTDGANRDMLVGDIAALADAFADLMSARQLCLRLDVVRDNACRRFHVDVVNARLICTYRGPGTQYGISMDGLEPKRVFAVPTGAPAILRGTLWPEFPPSGLLHRSPPIEGTGETRLVLVLDPVREADEST